MIVKKFLKRDARIAISIILLAFLLYRIDYRTSINLIAEANFTFILLALLALFGNIIFSSLRIEYILHIFKLKPGLKYLINLYLKGNFYNNFMPTQVGGDLYKAIRMSKDLSAQMKEQNKISDKEKEKLELSIKAHSIFAIFVDRFSGLLVLYFVGLIGLFLNFGIQGLITSILLLGFSVAGYIFAIKFLSKKIKLVEKFKEANQVFIQNKSNVGYILFSALCVQIFAIFTQIFCFWALGLNMSALRAFLYIPIITILGLIPSINGLGVQDAAYVFFFANTGLSQEQILASSILYHLIRFVASLSGGILVLFKR